MAVTTAAPSGGYTNVYKDAKILIPSAAGFSGARSLVALVSGAIVPEEDPDVQAARATHLTALHNSYLYHTSSWG